MTTPINSTIKSLLSHSLRASIMMTAGFVPLTLSQVPSRHADTRGLLVYAVSSTGASNWWRPEVAADWVLEFKQTHERSTSHLQNHYGYINLVSANIVDLSPLSSRLFMFWKDIFEDQNDSQMTTCVPSIMLLLPLTALCVLTLHSCTHPHLQDTFNHHPCLSCQISGYCNHV